MFICPICKKPLLEAGNTLKCENNHSYDISSSGYVNLLSPGKMNNKFAGDSKEMVRARTLFFESGAYDEIASVLCKIIDELDNQVIVDAGCGEGFYTEKIAKTHTESTVLGFDMTKFGCEHGAKVARRNQHKNLHYSVANIFDLPIESSFANIVVNAFAPVAGQEFCRVLKQGGHLIVLSAGISHLDGLKGVLYDEVYLNEEKFLPIEGFELCEVKNLKYEKKIIGSNTIYNLFTMTPYYHRTSLSDKKKLEEVSEILTNIEVNFAIYKKL